MSDANRLMVGVVAVASVLATAGVYITTRSVPDVLAMVTTTAVGGLLGITMPGSQTK